MENYRSTVKHDLGELRNSKRRLQDIFNIAFSHENMIAVERLNDLKLEEITYKELRREIENFASYLHHEYKPEDGEWIAIDLANGPLFLIAFWGSLMAGFNPYLVNSYYPLSLRLSLLDRLKIKKVLSLSKDYEDFVKPNLTSFSLRQETPKEEWWADNFALSSALTGMEAKIAIYDGKSISAEIENSEALLQANSWFMKDYRKRIKVAAILPFFHIFGIMVSYLWFAFYGRTMVFFNNLSTETVRATIIRHGVTHIFAPPLLFNKLCKGITEGVKQAGEKKQKAFNKGVNLISKIGDTSSKFAQFLAEHLMKEVRMQAFGESPKFMISGGAFIKPEVLKVVNAIGYPLFNGYGTTEASITGANLSLKFSERTNGSVGSPFPSITYLIDKDGSLSIKGTSLAKKIIYNDGRVEDIDTFQTNDLMKIKDGNYYIEGRKSDLFISSNGENVSPDLIEKALNVSLANAFSILELDDKLTLILQYNEGIASILMEKEISSLKEQLSKIAYGSSVTNIMVTFDPIANQNAIKPSRAQLKKAIKDGNVHLLSPKEFHKPERTEEGADETLKAIEEIFLSSLGEKVTITPDSDYFVDLGGDSMGYISLLLSLEKAFDIHFDLEKDNNLRTPMAFYKKIKDKQ